MSKQTFRIFKGFKKSKYKREHLSFYIRNEDIDYDNNSIFINIYIEGYNLLSYTIGEKNGGITALHTPKLDESLLKFSFNLIVPYTIVNPYNWYELPTLERRLDHVEGLYHLGDTIKFPKIIQFWIKLYYNTLKCQCNKIKNSKKFNSMPYYEFANLANNTVDRITKHGKIELL